MGRRLHQPPQPHTSQGIPPAAPQSRAHHTLPLRRPPTQQPAAAAAFEMGGARRVTQTPPPIRTAPAVEAARRSAATPPPLRTMHQQPQQPNAFFSDTFGLKSEWFDFHLK